MCLLRSFQRPIEHAILYGTGEEKVKLAHDSYDGSEVWTYEKAFEGVVNNLKRRYDESASDKVRQDIDHYMTQMICNSCNGTRLKSESLAIKENRLTINCSNLFVLDN